MNIIFGTAGFAREVDWLIYEVETAHNARFATDYFVAEDSNEWVGKEINSHVVLSETIFFERYSHEQNNYFVAVGSPILREMIVNKITSSSSNPRFPNLIHPSVSFDHRKGKIQLGEGTMLFSNTVVTTDVKIGKHVLVYTDCTIAHDSTVGDFTTLSPGVHISGNVNIQNKVFIGTGAVVLERIKISSMVTIGAGAVVINDVNEPGVYVGVPAKIIR